MENNSPSKGARQTKPTDAPPGAEGPRVLCLPAAWAHCPISLLKHLREAAWKDTFFSYLKKKQGTFLGEISHLCKAFTGHC